MRSVLRLLPVLLVLLQACSSVSPRRAEDAARSESQTIIYVARRGWHIDVGFAARELELPLASLRAALPSARYVFFGFGDQHYLIAKHKNFPGLLGALWPGAGIVLVSGIAGTPEAAFDAVHVIRLAVSPAQARAAQDFVWDSFAKDGAAAEPYARGPYPGSFYYSAVPKYSAVHTCNTWAAEALQSAGIAVHSFGVVFAGQLWFQLQRVEGADRASVSGDYSSAPSTTGGSVAARGNE
jgi:uncharacterized protein (TIGR02117 family)